MLLAAGEGLRLRPYTAILPKPCIPFLNLPMAFWSVQILNELGLEQIVYNTFHLPNAVQTMMNSHQSKLPPTIGVHDGQKLLGGGGGLNHSRDFFNSELNFVLANGDSVLFPRHPNQLNNALESHKSTNSLATLLCIKHSGAGTQFGAVWADENQGVKGFGKTSPSSNSQPWHFTGYAILNQQIFQFLPEGESNLIYDALVTALAQGKGVQVFPFDGMWFETGNWSDFSRGSAEGLKAISESEFLLNYVRSACEQFGYPSKLMRGQNGSLNWVCDGSNLANVDLSGWNVIGKSELRMSHIQDTVVGHGLKLDTCDLRNQLVLQSLTKNSVV